MSKEDEEANAGEWVWPEWTKRPFFDVCADGKRLFTWRQWELLEEKRRIDHG